MVSKLGIIPLLLLIWNNPILFILNSLDHAPDFTKSKIQTPFWSLPVLCLVPNICSFPVHWACWHFLLLLHPPGPSLVQCWDCTAWQCHILSNFGPFYEQGTIYFIHFIPWLCSLVFHWVPPQQLKVSCLLNFKSLCWLPLSLSRNIKNHLSTRDEYQMLALTAIRTQILILWLPIMLSRCQSCPSSVPLSRAGQPSLDSWNEIAVYSEQSRHSLTKAKFPIV